MTDGENNVTKVSAVVVAAIAVLGASLTAITFLYNMKEDMAVFRATTNASIEQLKNDITTIKQYLKPFSGHDDPRR